MALKRYPKNPVISPSSNWWETQATFNPGATVFNNKILLLYRALGGDGLSRFGLAESNDGENFNRFADPVLESEPDNSFERLGIEDPRITKIEDTFYIVYTAPSVYSAKTFRERDFAPSLSHLAPWRVRPSLITTQDFQNFNRRGILLDKDSKDALLLPEKIDGQFVLYHRIYPNVFITYSPDLKNWGNEKIVFQPRKDFWDSERVGMGAPPVKTDKGWLAIYHAVDKNHYYQLGLLLLDLKDPSKVLYRSPEPIFKPEADYETKGAVPNVVFTCGVVKRDEQLLIYYGAADKVVGLAYLDLRDLPF
jgi:predicted GH43/DUF377 family glycosyl hydrolase